MRRASTVTVALVMGTVAWSQPAPDGRSIETAVVLKSADGSLGGVASEAEWIREHYSGWRRTKQVLMSRNGRRYDRIELMRGEEKITLFFDITDAFGLR